MLNMRFCWDHFMENEQNQHNTLTVCFSLIAMTAMAKNKCIFLLVCRILNAVLNVVIHLKVLVVRIGGCRLSRLFRIELKLR